MIYALILSLILPLFAFAEDETVLIAILARNKDHTLPLYLKCIENLDYKKELITIYINTNDNLDQTEELLIDWAAKHKDHYRYIEFESHAANAVQTRPHEWNPERFSVLGKIRNESLHRTIEYGCDYYFVVDCDNFIIPSTLKDLIKKKKPIISPMLYSVPEPGDLYSNFFCATNQWGYYENHPDYLPTLQRERIGTFKVPVVHCTYLVDAKYIPKLTYQDGSNNFEFVIFANSARKNNVDQFICNEKIFGYQIHFHENYTLDEEKERFAKIQFPAPFN